VGLSLLSTLYLAFAADLLSTPRSAFVTLGLFAVSYAFGRMRSLVDTQ
jgi:hypothetical protein